MTISRWLSIPIIVAVFGMTFFFSGSLGIPKRADIKTDSQNTHKNTIEFRMSQTSAANGAIGISMEHFAKLINERTNNRYFISTFHNGQLGSERDNIEGCQLGTIDIAVVNQSPLGNFVSGISAVDLPYVIQSYEHADRVFLGEIGVGFLSQLADVRIHGLTIWESGFRNLTNNKININSVEDVKGLRIRVMENKIHQELWRSLDADPVPMAWGDAYTALQQGAIDGQENPSTVIDKNNVVEVNKRMAITEHCYATVFIIMSQNAWRSLTPDDQATFNECALEAGRFERRLSRKMEKEAMITLASQGMIITHPDKSGFIEKSQKVRNIFGEKYKDLLERINALSHS